MVRNKLKIVLVEKEMSVSDLAVLMGMKPNTLYTRLQGKTEFAISEIIEMKKILELSAYQVLEIFPELKLTDEDKISDQPV